MKISTLFLLAAALPSASAFAPTIQGARSGTIAGKNEPSFPTLSSSTTADESTGKRGGGAIIPSDPQTVQFAAGVLGGLAGAVVLGPLAGVAAAAGMNYVARKNEGDVGEAVTGVSRTAIDAYNYFADDHLGLFWSIENANPAVREKIDQFANMLEEYDVVDRTAVALGKIGDVVEGAIDKGLEMADEGGFADKINAAAKQSMDKVKDLSK